MTPFGAVAVKAVGAAGAAALLSLGVAGTLAQAASPGPNPSPAAAVHHRLPDPRADRLAIARAVFQSEADVLGLSPKALRADLRHGQNVSDLARDKGMTKAQFATALVDKVKPRLAALVSSKAITQAQADRAIDRISRGFVPFWDGIHRR